MEANILLDDCFFKVTGAFYEPLSVETSAASSVEETTATLNGNLTSAGGSTTVRFEYGTTTAYGTNTSNQTKGSTGTFSAAVTGLENGTLYHYRAFANDTSSDDTGDDATFLTKPLAPTGFSVSAINATSANVTWTNGDGANRTVIVRKAGSYPTSPTDGTAIYNGTGTVADLALAGYYANAWSLAYWGTGPSYLSQWSDEGTNITYGALTVGVYNESNPIQQISPFSIFVTNEEGTDVYEETNCSGLTTINTSFLPLGDDIQLIFVADDYKQRVYYVDLTLGTWLNFTAYLPPITQNESTNSTYTLRTFIDAAAVTTNASNKVMALTYTPENIISVEVFNESYYGTYGGWEVVPSDYYSLTGKTLTIDKAILDWNSTIIRATYWYRDYGDQLTLLYLFNVVNPNSQPIKNAHVTIKHYINTTGIFQEVSSLMTDGNGQANIYLVPEDLYKFIINRTGYQNETADWIPTDQIFTHTFMMDYIEFIPQPEKHPHEYVFFSNLSSRNNTNLTLHFHDTLGETLNVQFIIYEINATTGNQTVFYTNTSVTASEWWANFTNLTANNSYSVAVYYNHTTFGPQAMTIVFPANRTTVTTPATFNVMMTNIFGVNPLVWSHLVMFLLMVALFFWCDREHAGVGLIVIGGIFIFINTYLGFDDALGVVAGGMLPGLFIIVGIMVEWINRKVAA